MNTEYLKIKKLTKEGCADTQCDHNILQEQREGSIFGTKGKERCNKEAVYVLYDMPDDDPAHLYCASHTTDYIDEFKQLIEPPEKEGI